MAKVVLYTYWRSSSAYRVRIALALKNVAHESITVNLLAGEQQAAEYVATKNPMAHVPTLVVDGETFVESVAIIELLEDLYPSPPLLPKDPAARAHVRALVEIVNSGTQPLQNLQVLKRLPSEDARKEWAAHFIEKGLRAFESLLSARDDNGPYACGEAMSMADVFLVPQMMNAIRYGVNLEPMPRVRRAYEKAKQHPAVVAALPETQPDAPKSP